MHAAAWMERIRVLVRADQNGDSEPLRLTCQRLAHMEERLAELEQSQLPVAPKQAGKRRGGTLAGGKGEESGANVE